MSDTEPTVALESIEHGAGTLWMLREIRGKIKELEKQKKKLEADLRRAAGTAHVVTFGEDVVITNRPTDRFRGEDFGKEQPILAKEFTRPVLVDQLDLEALKAAHPAIYEQYQSRTFKILDV
jgi:predicted phage-related endonuclease